MIFLPGTRECPQGVNVKWVAVTLCRYALAYINPADARKMHPGGELKRLSRPGFQPDPAACGGKETMVIKVV